MNKLTALLLIILGSLAMPALGQAPVEVAQDQRALLESDDPQLEANKRMVYEFWRLVFNTRDMSLAPQYMQEDYIQHNPNVPSGRQPFIDYFGSLPQQPVQDTIPDLVHIMAEGDYVTLAFRRQFPHPENEGETYATTWFDMFRIEDGKLAEHWDYGTIGSLPTE